MFKKISNWLSGAPSKKTVKRTTAPKKKNTQKNLARENQQKAGSVRSDQLEDDPKSLVEAAIFEAEKTLAFEEKVAGHDPNHLTAVQNAMMIYRQKQESFDKISLEEKAKLRALGELVFNGDLKKADGKKKKLH